MQRLLYSLLLYLALPFVPLKLLWRGIKQPSYLKHWAERFGFAYSQTQAPIICVHCVSVGETQAAAPLIEALLNTYPNHQVLVTHGTPTGRDTSHALFGDRVLRAYLPYDLPFAVKRFLKHFKPAIVVLMETEIWFNLIQQCHKQQVPTMLVNARLSEKSAKGYAKLQNLMATSLQQLSAISTQTEADASRFSRFGVTPLVNGNLKFDVSIPKKLLSLGQQLKQQINHPFIFVAASTRDGEEALIIKAIQALNNPDLFTIIVPRHPQRFDAVANLLNEHQLTYIRKSALNPNDQLNNTHWMLGDTMGELASYYAAADVAFVGGSLLPLGGQNMIEPCAVGTPVIIGPHTFNFELVAEQVVTAGAAVRVQDSQGLQSALQSLLQQNENAKQRRQQMQQQGKTFVAAHQGATNQTLALIKAQLKA